MKRLWTYIPPCMSDVLGFQDTMNNTEGLAIIDDASGYKPSRFAASTQPQAEGGFRGGRGHGGFGGHGHGGGRGGFGGERKVVSTELEESDIVEGTMKKVMAAFRSAAAERTPKFVLLATAPCAAMIGTDLGEAAAKITEETGIPAAALDLDGQKDYLYGIGKTLEAMGKLLLKPAAKRPGTVNLLGCNTVDWPPEQVAAAAEWIEGEGYTVLSRWGSPESHENLLAASAASANLVVNISGLRLAQYMEVTFGIPYVMGAPFGEGQCRDILDQLMGAGRELKRLTPVENPRILVLGEQLLANAIRHTLLKKGLRGVKVASFFELSRNFDGVEGVKLNSEEELRTLLTAPGLELVLGSADYRLPETPASVKWIGLPDFSSWAPANRVPAQVWVRERLDQWLEEKLKEQGML